MVEHVPARARHPDPGIPLNYLPGTVLPAPHMLSHMSSGSDLIRSGAPTAPAPEGAGRAAEDTPDRAVGIRPVRRQRIRQANTPEKRITLA